MTLLQLFCYGIVYAVGGLVALWLLLTFLGTCLCGWVKWSERGKS